MKLQITPNDAAQRMYDAGGKLLPNISLIDVRNADDFADGHLPGATHADYQRQLEVFERVQQAPASSKQLVLICYAGVRSGRVAERAAQKGFDACSISGGIAAWRAHGLPTTRDSNA